MGNGDGSLTVVGTGITVLRQTTLEAVQAIRRAEKLFYLVANDVTARWLEAENASAESLDVCLVEGRPRSEAYADMVERVLAPVRSGLGVCAAFYGHPGVFVNASHAAIRRARAEGYRAEMLPAVSALDCLVADLGVDPADNGAQCFEATDFLLRERRFDPRSLLVLWQVGLIGRFDAWDGVCGPSGAATLARALRREYPLDHEVIVYEASQHPAAPARVDRVPLSALEGVALGPVSTLVVPGIDPAVQAATGETEEP